MEEQTILVYPRGYQVGDEYFTDWDAAVVAANRKPEKEVRRQVARGPQRNADHTRHTQESQHPEA